MTECDAKQYTHLIPGTRVNEGTILVLPQYLTLTHKAGCVYDQYCSCITAATS